MLSPGMGDDKCTEKEWEWGTWQNCFPCHVGRVETSENVSFWYVASSSSENSYLVFYIGCGQAGSEEMFLRELPEAICQKKTASGSFD
jgi:hypothetical protein